MLIIVYGRFSKAYKVSPAAHDETGLTRPGRYTRKTSFGVLKSIVIASDCLLYCCCEPWSLVLRAPELQRWHHDEIERTRSLSC